MADQLAAGPKSADELAAATGTHAPSLYRLLRSLAGLGLVHELEDQSFELTVLGEALQSNAPGAARSTLLYLAGHSAWKSWGEILHSLQTGEPGFDKAFGMPVFEHLSRHPDEAFNFSQAMLGFHGAEPLAIAAAYDFSSLRILADVGGSSGNMLTAILSRHAGLRGLLFDLPHAVRDAPTVFERAGLSARVDIQAGNFFESVPAGADAYLLSHILHDWSEAQCVTILENCRRAMKPGSRLLIVEMILPSGDASHPGKLLDMAMLAITGGQERTEVEYRALLARGGFELLRVIPTASAASVMEAVTLD